MNRRRFLGIGAATGLTGLGLGSCGARPPPLTGGLLGPDIGLGHQLRAGAFPPPAARRSATVVIAGGGVSGLSAAWWLKRNGCDDFILLELESEVGGNSRFGESAVTRYPWGAHYLALPSSEAQELILLLEDMGIVTGKSAGGDPLYDERYLLFPPRERLFVEGRWRPGLKEFDDAGASFGRFSALLREHFDARGDDGCRAFASPAALSSHDARWRQLDGISMAAWLKGRGLDDPRLNWYVDYACRDDFGCTARDTSAWAGVHYFVARAPAGRYADDTVLTAPEGNGFLTAAMARPLADRIVRGELVYRVAQDRRTVTLLTWNGAQATEWRARQAILALPQFVLPHIIAGRPVAGFEYAPWVVANLHVRELPRGGGVTTAWDNVLYDSPALGYVVATHQLLRQHVGASVLTWYMPVTQRPAVAARAEVLRKSWREWVDIILADLRRAHPDIDDLVTHVDVWRWGHGMIKPLPGTLTGAELARARVSVGNIHFAHTDLSGMSLFEEAHYWGVRAAEAVLARMK